MATVTKSIGTSSRDYSTMTAWEADLDNTLVYVSGDDAVGECYNDSTFTEANVLINGGGTVSLNTITLTVAQTERHDGTSASGAYWGNSQAGNMLELSSTGIDTEISWLDLYKSSDPSSSTTMILANTSDAHTIKNNIVRDCTITAGVMRGIIVSNNAHIVMNNFVYNLSQNQNSSSGLIGIGTLSVNSASYYNNTIANLVNDQGSGFCLGIDAGSSATVTNCISMSTTGTSSGNKFNFGLDTAETFSMSEDTSANGSNCLNNKVYADQFVSTASGSEDLHLKAGSDAIGAGTDLGTSPAGVQYDIDGVDRDARGTTWDMGADQATATITKTIGTTARDYSTMTLWEADLDTTIYQSGDDAVGECYNDSVFDEAVTFNGGGTVGITSATLSVATGERHDGTAGTGARVVWTTASSTSAKFLSSFSGSPVSRTFKWLELDGNGNAIEGALSLATGGSLAYQGIADKLLIHGSLETLGRVYGVKCPSKYSDVLNCIVYDMESTLAGGQQVVGIETADTNSKILNCTVYNITSDAGSSYTRGVSNLNGTTTVVQNTIAMDSLDDDFGGTTPATESHNLSSDATAAGTGSLTSKTAGNQFVSIVSGSEDLHLKSGSDAIGAGTDLGATPDGVQYDIDGVDRDARGTVWDIGADQATGAVTKTIGTAARDYSTMTLWEAGLDDATVYQSGDDAVGECYNDSTFTAEADIVIARTDLSSMILKAADGEGHDGTSGTGVVINTTAPNHIRYRDAHVPLIVERIELAGSTIAIRTNRLATYKRMLIHNSGSTFATEGGQEPATLMNSIIYTATTGPNCLGHKNYNNTIYNMTNDGVTNAVAANGGEVKNTISVGNGGEDFDTGTAQSESYCMSSDTTASGTGSITSVVTADQFVSIVSGSEDLHLKAGSDAIGAGVDLGTTPDGVQYDIDGVDRDARGTTWDIGADQAAATITKTIGTTARDYSTMTLWEADLDDSTVYQSGDDAVGECYNDSTFDESVAINGGLTVGLNTFTLTAATGEEHDGTAGTGVRIVNGSSPVGITLSVSSSWDTNFCTISDIEIDRNGYGIANNKLMVIATDRCYLFRMLLHGSLDTGNGTGACVSGFQKFSAVSNNIIYDLKSTASNDEKITGITMGRAGFASYCYNNTVFDLNTTSTDAGCVIIGINNVAGSVSNNISMDCIAGGGTNEDFNGVQTGNNLSSDSTASGTGSLTSKTSSDQFVSIVSGSEDLHLKAGSDAIGAGVDLGTTPTGVEIDIDGRDRDAEGDTWSIGADQFVEILYRHFFTRLGLRATPQAYWFWEGSRTVSEEEEGSKGKNFFIFFY